MWPLICSAKLRPDMLANVGCDAGPLHQARTELINQLEAPAAFSWRTRSGWKGLAELPPGRNKLLLVLLSFQDGKVAEFLRLMMNLQVLAK